MKILRLLPALLLACAPMAAAAPPPKAAKPATAPKPAGKPKPAASPRQAEAAAQPVTIVDGEYILGSLSAKVVVTEYGAPTCPYCKKWHDTVYAPLKRDYVDTGKIRFAFRELPSHNPAVDAAIFAIARCTTKEKYFDVIDAAFDQQADIEASNKAPTGPMPKLTALAGQFGLTPDKFAGPCLDSVSLKTRLATVKQLAIRDQVPGTPSILINGVMVSDEAMDDEKALRALLDKAIAAAR